MFLEGRPVVLQFAVLNFCNIRFKGLPGQQGQMGPPGAKGSKVRNVARINTTMLCSKLSIPKS